MQKLTETGVDRIVPLVAARSVVRWDDAKAAKNVVRLRRIAREAAMQSRRSWLPVLDDITPFDRAVGTLGDGVALADPGGDPPALTLCTVFLLSWAAELFQLEVSRALALALQKQASEARIASRAFQIGELTAGTLARHSNSLSLNPPTHSWTFHATTAPDAHASTIRTSGSAQMRSSPPQGNHSSGLARRTTKLTPRVVA